MPPTQNCINNSIEPTTLDVLSVKVDPGSSGDSAIQLDINNINEFKIGVDDTDSDAFKISQGGALGTNDTLAIYPDGERRLPLNPSVLGYLSSQAANETGDGTLAKVDYDAEIYDQGGDFATGTFTAPVTGRYFVCYMVKFGDTAGTDTLTNITTSNRTYQTNRINPSAMESSSNYYTVLSQTIADMDAADTLTIDSRSSNATKVVDFEGAADPMVTLVAVNLVSQEHYENFV